MHPGSAYFEDLVLDEVFSILPQFLTIFKKTAVQSCHYCEKLSFGGLVTARLSEPYYHTNAETSVEIRKFRSSRRNRFLAKLLDVAGSAGVELLRGGEGRPSFIADPYSVLQTHHRTIDQNSGKTSGLFCLRKSHIRHMLPYELDIQVDDGDDAKRQRVSAHLMKR